MSRILKQTMPKPSDWKYSLEAAELLKEAQTETVDRKSQAARILRLFLDRRGNDIPLPMIMKCAAQYNACIHALRRAGFRIVNFNSRQDGVLHSWYRLEMEDPEDLTTNCYLRKRPRPSISEPQTGLLFTEAAQRTNLLDHFQPWQDPEMGGRHGR